MAIELEDNDIRVHAVHPGKAATKNFPRLKRSKVLDFTGTDIESVARVAVAQIGKESGEVFVPGNLRGISLLHGFFPGFVTRAVSKATK
jgi:short-subunit dehydrogenase